MQYLLTIVYILITTSGITFMKLGGDSIKLGLNDGFSLSMGWKSFIGLCLYLVSFILWQKLLIKYDLSVMVPIVTGIVQLIILIIGYVIFKETFNPISLVGALLIIVGIIIMAFASR